ncbi:MAG: TIGR04283 family arsenosugar biosynthesis glycosyltransferase [Deltaproteobacteria bacterium]|nr:TIGR04283 family arsenosugar biosynthesis glycosyltransferase [Deltaproteobacteria bacterium]
MKISVIIPVLNEEKTIGSTLEALRRLYPVPQKAPHVSAGMNVPNFPEGQRPKATDVSPWYGVYSGEIIVVDGGSTDKTRDIAAKERVMIVTSPRGRARQMNHGARLACGDVFLFLHADSRLPLSATSDILSALEDPRCVGGRFDVRLDDERWMFWLIGNLISLRSRLTQVATGDQAIFVRRRVFEEIGGFLDIPLMEDIAFSRMLKKKGRVACLKSRVVTSARRWEIEGIWRTILKMWLLRLLFLAGVSPFRLRRFYGDAR